MSTVIFLLFVHWFADFVCQTRWMAQGKSKSFSILLIHVCTYGWVLATTLELYLISAGISVTDYNYITFMWINIILHGVTDFITSRVSSYFWRKENTHAFFTTVGFDQFLHQLCLIVTSQYYLG